MIGPETRGAIPMMFALDTASSVRGCRSLRPHAHRLKTTARPNMVKPKIRTKKRLNFPAPRLWPDSVERSGFPFGLVFMCLPREEAEPDRDAENQDQADAQEETPKAGRSNINHSSHPAGDDGKDNPGCQGN